MTLLSVLLRMSCLLCVLRFVLLALLLAAVHFRNILGNKFPVHKIYGLCRVLVIANLLLVLVHAIVHFLDTQCRYCIGRLGRAVRKILNRHV